jgi:hypothetical protein
MAEVNEESRADLLYGVPAIAAHLGLTDKQVYHMRDRDKLPTFKMGGKVCALRSALARHFADLEAKATAGKVDQ